MRRKLTEEEVLERKIQRLYHEYRVDCRECMRICEEEDRKSEYRNIIEKVWKTEYSEKVNSLNDELAVLMRKRA